MENVRELREQKFTF